MVRVLLAGLPASERLPCRPEVLNVDVDGGQDCLLAEAPEQADAGDARAGSDLDGGLGLGSGGQHGQDSTDARSDRRYTQFKRAFPGAQHDLILSGQIFCIGPAAGFVGAHGFRFLGGAGNVFYSLLCPAETAVPAGTPPPPFRPRLKLRRNQEIPSQV